MSTVRLCLWCGLVNDWRAAACDYCGEALPHPGFRRSWLTPGMRIEIEPLDPRLTARRLGRGRIFVGPKRRVGVVRRHYVSAPGFLAPSAPREIEDLPVPSHPVLARAMAPLALLWLALGSALGVVGDVLRALDWFMRLWIESVGRAVFRTPYVVEASLDGGDRLFWKVKGRRPREVIDEIAEAMTLGDYGFVPAGGERFHLD